MHELPELVSLRRRADLIRIPDELDVPLTPRVKRLIDTKAFRRLSSISQLGLVALVYPGARHSRFEHSLGVYRNVLLYLDRLSHDLLFQQLVDDESAGRLIVAALLHDLGHWPFCHPIEDLSLESVPEHESFVRTWLHSEEIAKLLKQDWDLTPEDICSLLEGRGDGPSYALLRSILSGPIDVDKLDYLYRDSLHAGIPYGRNFDRHRLVGSLCVQPETFRIALDEKAKTAAEMMVFARYVMFSEVYWHHAVRAATAMFQRAFYQLFLNGGDWESWFMLDEPTLVRQLQGPAEKAGAGEIWAGLFGDHRRLYKRLAQFSVFEGAPVYEAIARRPYPWLVDCSARLAIKLSEEWGTRVEPQDVLIDAPPVGLEVEFKVDLRTGRDERFRPLGEVSPVVRTLATQQFDDYVKRVRVFVHPRFTSYHSPGLAIDELMLEAIEKT